LRVKESRPPFGHGGGAGAAGARVEETEDGLTIDGTGGDPLRGSANSRVATHLDHRIAMAWRWLALRAARGSR
jgi:3-phosphoshikimate 1-carboxyvinyltransferase